MGSLPKTNRQRTGFTIVELIIIIAVVALLAAIAILAFTGMQKRSADMLVQRTVADAQKTLQTYNIFNRYYPANIANTEYAPPLSVAMSLYTDTPQMPVYQNLTADQNAQLLLNSCNGFMPVVSGGTTYNTACVYNGNNMHIKGQVTSNVILNGPTINQADFVLTCGASCSAAQNSIISTFIAQGGSFPITVPSKGSTLPAPTIVNAGNASRYCLEARSPAYSDIIYHAAPSSSSPEQGACPADAALHYP